MKNILLAFVLIGIFSCKKKKDDTTEETPPVVTPTKGNTMTAKVNGNAWAIMGNNTSSAKIDQSMNSGSPKQYVFIGRSESSLYKNAIWLYTPFTTGTVDLRTTPGCSAIYFDNSGVGYYIKSGSMNIATMDTSKVKFKATFSFITDSIGNVGYKIDEGAIDFEAP